MSSPVPPAPYAGNPSLPPEVREKILSTFRHALTLFDSGNVNDCLIGCEFILKMDPRFTPARRLQEKVRNRDSDVDLGELREAASLGSPAGSASAPPSPPPPTAEKADPQRLLAEASKRYDALDLDGAILAATRALVLLPGNAEALAIIEKAAERKTSQSAAGAPGGRSSDSEELSIAPSDARSGAGSPSDGPAAMPDFSLDPQGPDPFALGSREGGFSGASSEPAGIDPYSSRSPAAPPNPPAFPSDPETPAPAASADLFLPAEEPSVPRVPSLASPPSQADAEETRVSKREIAALLKQGDETARAGQWQQAIEVWSRVFLIDINNADAVTRIEKARQEMADRGRLVADFLKRGRESFEAGDFEGARKLFLQAQESDPSEATARLYLDRIEQAKADKPAAAAPRASGKGAASEPPIDDFSDTPAAVPAAVARPSAPRAAGLRVNPRVLGLIGAFLALTLVGVYFVFKGPKNREPAPREASAASLQHARDLLGQGKIAEARSELRRIGPADPDSEEARKLLADLGKTGADSSGDKSAPPREPPAATDGEVRGNADSTRLRATAEKAFAEKRYIEALKDFNLAAPAFRSDPSFAQEQGLAAEKVTALTPAVKFYNEGEYDTAIPILWRIVQDDRDNRDARSYLLRSYYNQGISQLQNGLYPKAAQAFQEVLALDPNDAESLRHKKFAERYQKGDLDLMGRIYVRHLNRRP